MQDILLEWRAARAAPALIAAALVCATPEGAHAVGAVPCDQAPGTTAVPDQDGLRPGNGPDYKGPTATPHNALGTSDTSTCYQAVINFLDPGDDGTPQRGPQNQFNEDVTGGVSGGRFQPSFQGEYHYNLFHDLAPFTIPFIGSFAPGLDTTNSEFTLRALNADGEAYTNPSTNNAAGGLHSNNNGWGVRHSAPNGANRTALQNNQILELSFAFRNENGFAATVANNGGIVNCEVNGAEGDTSTRPNPDGQGRFPEGSPDGTCTEEQATANARTNQVLSQGPTNSEIVVQQAPATQSHSTDTAGGAVVVNRWQWLTLTSVELFAHSVTARGTIIGFDDDDNETGRVDLVPSSNGTATYVVGLQGSRFHIVGTAEATAQVGFRLRNALFQYRQTGQNGMIPLPGALIPALTGLAALGGLAARRRRRRKAEAA